MTHFRKLMDPGKFIQPWELPPSGALVTITRIEKSAPDEEDKKKKSLQLCYFKTAGADVEAPRPYRVPALVMQAIAIIYGNDYEGWIGKEITVIPGKCARGAEIEDCIRIVLDANQDGKLKKYIKSKQLSISMWMVKI